MTDPSLTFELAICEGIPNAISSPGSVDGHTPCAAPDGTMTDLFGQALAPVSHSAQLVKAMSSQMSATYGRHGSGSRSSCDLTLFLANKYQARTLSLGSTMFDLIWKQMVTPSGFSIPAQRALGRRTSGNDCTSWPTPNAGPQNDTDSNWEARQVLVQEAPRQQRVRNDTRDGGITGAVDYPVRRKGGHDEGRAAGRTSSAPSPVNGFWSDAEWIACRDGISRPTKPGLFPLAHGVTGRVGKLRAAGNCIVAPQAQEFVSAYMEATS